MFGTVDEEMLQHSKKKVADGLEMYTLANDSGQQMILKLALNKFLERKL